MRRALRDILDYQRFFRSFCYFTVALAFALAGFRRVDFSRFRLTDSLVDCIYLAGQVEEDGCDH